MPHSSSRIRVLLADDQAMLLSALSTILTAQEDIEVTATATSGAEAVKSALAHHIDVAILDIRMPGMDGISAAQAILERKPECRIIMLTTFNDEELVAQSISTGANRLPIEGCRPRGSRDRRARCGAGGIGIGRRGYRPCARGLSLRAHAR